MFDALYKRRLERDLQTWRERGWVSPEAAKSILATVEVDGRPRTAIIVGFLGAVLIAFAALAFVAANWADMARPVRMAILAGGMTLCYGIAVVLDRARHPWFADAAVFAGSALFGASIMLVAQSYHISGDYPDALLLWGAGAFFAAVLGPSRASLILALVAFALWAWYEIFDFRWVLHWPSLVALALVAIVAGTWRWRPGMHLVVLALAAWIAVNVISVADHLDWSSPAAMSLVAAAAAAIFAAGRFLVRRAPWTRAGMFGPVLAVYGLFGFLVLQILIQMAATADSSADIGDDGSALTAALILAGATAVLLLGSCTRLRDMLLDAAIPVGAVVAMIGLVYLAASNAESGELVGIQVLLGILTLVTSLWAVSFGNRIDSRAAATFGLLAFAGEVLYLYFVTFGTLLDTALFFLIGGILLIGLAAVLVRLQRRLTAPDRNQPPGPGAAVEQGDPA